MSALQTIPPGPMVAGNLMHFDGRTYAVEGPHADPDGAALAVELWPINHLGDRTPTSYTVSAEANPDPTRTCAGGLACDCPDFMFRHAGTGSKGCKHIRAALAVGLVRILAETP
jgi:hypothetical protein